MESELQRSTAHRLHVYPDASPPRARHPTDEITCRMDGLIFPLHTCGIGSDNSLAVTMVAKLRLFVREKNQGANRGPRVLPRGSQQGMMTRRSKASKLSPR